MLRISTVHLRTQGENPLMSTDDHAKIINTISHFKNLSAEYTREQLELSEAPRGPGQIRNAVKRYRATNRITEEREAEIEERLEEYLRLMTVAVAQVMRLDEGDLGTTRDKFCGYFEETCEGTRIVYYEGEDLPPEVEAALNGATQTDGASSSTAATSTFSDRKDAAAATFSDRKDAATTTEEWVASTGGRGAAAAEEEATTLGLDGDGEAQVPLQVPESWPQPLVLTCEGVRRAGRAAEALTASDFEKWTKYELEGCLETLGAIDWDKDTKIDIWTLLTEKKVRKLL